MLNSIYHAWLGVLVLLGVEPFALPLDGFGVDSLDPFANFLFFFEDTTGGLVKSAMIRSSNCDPHAGHLRFFGIMLMIQRQTEQTYPRSTDFPVIKQLAR